MTLTQICVCIHALFILATACHSVVVHHWKWKSIKEGLSLPYSQPVWTACLWWNGRTAQPRWPVYVFAPLWASSVRFYALIWALSPAGGCARLCTVVSESYRCLGTDVWSGALSSERKKCKKHTWALNIQAKKCLLIIWCVFASLECLITCRLHLRRLGLTEALCGISPLQLPNMSLFLDNISQCTLELCGTKIWI